MTTNPLQALYSQANKRPDDRLIGQLRYSGSELRILSCDHMTVMTITEETEGFEVTLQEPGKDLVQKIMTFSEIETFIAEF